MQRDEPHHQGEGPRLRPDLDRQGRRERPRRARREPRLLPLGLRTGDGRERRCAEPAGTTGWPAQERLERRAVIVVTGKVGKNTSSPRRDAPC